MMSRQTLRPNEQTDTLKGATIVTQLNRDNLESFGGPSAGGNDEIDDLVLWIDIRFASRVNTKLPKPSS